MAQPYTVTAGTSIVLISSLQSPNTVVLLSSIQYPGHIVGIRDITGSNQISQTPVIISTMSSLKFYDGTSSITLNTPNGFLSLSSRDPFTWQLLNSVGFLTTLSTGFLETLTVEKAFVTTTSSLQEFTSSLIARNVTVSKSIQVLGNTNIEGDIQIGGSFNIFSTLHAYETVNLSSSLDVGGNVSFPSSLFIKDSLTVGSNLSTFQNMIVGDNLIINKSLYVKGALLPPFLSVQTLTADVLTLGGGMLVGGGVSTVSLSTLDSVFVAGRGTFQQGLFVSGTTTVASSLSVDGLVQTSSFLAKDLFPYSGIILQDVRASTLAASGSLSTYQSFVLLNRASLEGDGLVYLPISVKSTSVVENLTVLGESLFSSLRVSTLATSGYVSSYGSTFVVSDELYVGSTLAVGGDLIARGKEGGPSVFSLFSTNFTTSTLNIEGNLFTTLLDVQQSSWINGSASLSTITVEGNVSTTELSVNGSLIISGNLNVGQVASASTLGAPIRFDISTLTLSNTLTVNSYASIPFLTVGQNPDKLAAGVDFTERGVYDVYVDGTLQNQQIVSQAEVALNGKLWFANSLQTSTLSGLSNLSSIVIGPTSFSYPLAREPYPGIIAGGIPTTGNRIFFASNVSSIYRPCESITPSFLAGFTPKRVRYNGTNLWVAVGDGPSGNSFLYSQNGYVWSQGTGFTITSVNDVAYGAGKWVAVGSNASGFSAAFSLSGINWLPLNIFNNPDYGTGVAYNGFQWVAVGAFQQFPGFFLGRAYYSFDGISWSLAAGSIFTPLTCVVWGGIKWFASGTLNMSGFVNIYESAIGTSWISAIGYTQNIEYIAYNGINFVCVGPALSGNSLTTVTLSPNMIGRQDVGIFLQAAKDVVWDAATQTWIVAGYGVLASDTTVAASKDGISWSPISAFAGSNFTISPGTIQTPNFFPYFTPNLTSIFHSTLSSQQVTTSTVQASSIQGTFFGDGSRLTNITQYTSTLFVSSITAKEIRTHDISAALTSFMNTSAQDSVRVNKQTFLSSGNIFLAAGNDITARGSIQTSANGANWTRVLTNNFRFFGNGVAGNGDIQNPFYVAVGADSRTNYTIQWSTDGEIWNPVLSGGFAYATAAGVRQGTSVAYKNGIWVAGGVYLGSTATIQYSTDGKNWQEADGGLQDSIVKVIPNPSPGVRLFYAIGKGITASFDGILWITALIDNPPAPVEELTFTAIAGGLRFIFGSLLQEGYIAADSLGRLYYSNGLDGINFAYYGTSAAGPVNDLIYRGNADWTAIGSNSVQTSANGWTFTVATTINDVISLNSITFNSTLMRYVMGATAIEAQNTLLYSSDSLSWFPAANQRGFSTAVEVYGQGYGIVSLNPSSIFAVGNSALTVDTEVKPAILKLFSTANSTLDTQISLTASNASNLFSSVVRGIGATNSEFYKYVAVGDGFTPQKTIARSTDGSPESWIPAITGGFSTTGYGVTYFRDKWIAVGDAQSSRNTIQYSPDGANWFGTNDSSGIRRGGRGVAAGISTLSSVIVAVGKDTTTRGIVYSLDGFTWSTTKGEYFNVQGNAVACGLGYTPPSTLFVAVGEDTRGSSNTVLRSRDGINWFGTGEGFFSLFDQGGFGVAYGNNTWVVVGQESASRTIWYSQDGAQTFSQATNGFTYAGYGVTYSEGLSSFFAVGKDINGNSPLTVKYSKQGDAWTNFSTGSGFLSQKAVGSANGLMSQGVLTAESLPLITFSNLVVYERTSPLLYPIPSIRVSTNFVSFSEGMFVNLSSQVAFGSNSFYETAAVSVNPFSTLVSSLLYRGPLFLSSVSLFSSISVSSISTLASSFFLTPIQTPSLTLNPPSTLVYSGGVPTFSVENTSFLENTANYITPQITASGHLLTVNDALRVDYLVGNFVLPRSNSMLNIGNRNITTAAEVNVGGTFGATTLSSQYIYAPQNIYISATKLYYRDTNFSIGEGTNPSFVTPNTLRTEPSSMTFNSLMTLQVSTQKVGVYTQNPQFELDVQRNAVLGKVQANTINTSLLFLTLQTFNN